MQSAIDPLIGRHFRSLAPLPHDGDTPHEVGWQGIVLGCPQPGFYLVQLLEFEKGNHNTQRLVKIEDMLTWLFYEDKQQMLAR